MNIKDYVRTGHRILNLIFWMIVGYLAGDNGMGLYYVAFVIYYLVFALFMGGIKEAIARRIAVLKSKGFHDNASKVFQSGILYCLVVSLIIFINFWWLGRGLCMTLFGYGLPSSVLGMFGIYYFLSSIDACVKGYYQGKGNIFNCLVAEIASSVILIVLSPFVVKSMYNYGNKVSALLKNPLYSNTNGAIGAVIVQCIAVAVSIIIVVVGIITTREQEGYDNSVKGLGTMFSFLKNFFMIHISGLEEKLFPIITLATMVIIFVKAGATLQADSSALFTSLGVYAGKCLIVIAAPFTLFVDYIDRERRKLKADYNKDEHKNVRTRTGYILKNTAYIMFPVSITTIVLAKPIVMIFFGGKMSLGVTLVREAGIVIFFGAVCYACKAILRSVALDRYALIGSLSGFVAMLVFLLPSTSSNLTINLLAYALLVSYLVETVVLVLLVYRMIGIFIIDIGTKCAQVVIGVAIMAIIQAVLDKLIAMNILYLALTLAISYAAYFIAVGVTGGISRKDINSLKGTLFYYPTYFIGSYFGRG